MTKAQVNEHLENILATVDAQPPDVRDRLLLAIKSDLFDVQRAGPDELVLTVRGIGDLLSVRVPLPPSDGRKN